MRQSSAVRVPAEKRRKSDSVGGGRAGAIIKFYDRAQTRTRIIIILLLLVPYE